MYNNLFLHVQNYTYLIICTILIFNPNPITTLIIQNICDVNILNFLLEYQKHFQSREYHNERVKWPTAFNH